MDWLSRWIHDLSAKYLPFGAPNGQEQRYVQFAVRPVQLLEMVFPEEMLEPVLSMVQPYEEKHGTKFVAAMFRKVLGLQAMPKRKAPALRPPHPLYVQRPFVGVVGVGLKKDPRNAKGEELL